MYLTCTFLVVTTTAREDATKKRAFTAALRAEQDLEEARGFRQDKGMFLLTLSAFILTNYWQTILVEWMMTMTALSQKKVL